MAALCHKLLLLIISLLFVVTTSAQADQIVCLVAPCPTSYIEYGVITVNMTIVSFPDATGKCLYVCQANKLLPVRLTALQVYWWRLWRILSLRSKYSPDCRVRSTTLWYQVRRFTIRLDDLDKTVIDFPVHSMAWQDRCEYELCASNGEILIVIVTVMDQAQQAWFS